MKRRFSLATVAVAMLLAMPLAAQEAATPVVPTGAAATPSHSARNVALMARRVSLHLDHVTLRDALSALSAQAQIPIVYAWREVPVSRVVSLVADSISVQDAIAALLRNTGTEPVISETGQILLRPSGDISRSVAFDRLQQGAASISGLVTDSGTGASIPQVTVHIDGTSLSVKSGSDGQYKITGVAAGEYRITARRVGYLAKTRTITLVDGDNKKLDFNLNPPATQLNEVVTTALGEQRRYQVGNVISTINVDSIAPDAPVTSVTDLITGRAPGVEVVETSGLAGAGEAIRIRGQSSMLLQGDPIIIVDGIRQENTAGGTVYYNNGGFNSTALAPARINDIDFSQIASIDILKGPTATTEYGTDAANGVIVITTKRGTSGSPQWNAAANFSASSVPSDLPNTYWDWGHSVNGKAKPFTTVSGTGPSCTLAAAPGYYSGNGEQLTAGQCVVDSVTAFNPLNNALTTMYGTGPGAKYDASVGGGSDALRYYVAGDAATTVGVLHVPDVFRSQAEALGYGESTIDPNSLDQSSLRANTTIRVNPVMDVQLISAYLSTYQETPVSSLLTAISQAPSVDDSAFFYGYGTPHKGGNPLLNLGTQGSQQTEVWRGGATLDWRPAPWLSGHATAGIDHAAFTQQYQQTAQAELVGSQLSDTAGGSLSEQQGRTDVYTVDLRGSATATLFHHVRVISTLGAQYVDTRTQSVAAEAYNLSASAFSFNGGTGLTATQTSAGAATAGFYVEENLGLDDRCYIPLGLRFDAASGFGQSIAGGGATYPKYGISCLVLNGATTLRVRTEFGAAGQQPPYGAASSTFIVQPYQIGSASGTTGYAFNAPGNAGLKPEDEQEMEGGMDLGLWGNRVSASLTGYTKYTHNALYTIPSLGFTLQGDYTENIGDVRNTGFEAAVTVVLVQQRQIDFEITSDYSVNHNKLLRIAPGILSTSAGNVWQEFRAGYPLYGYWGDSVTFTDANSDGILEANEVGIGQTLVYTGSSLPIATWSLAPSAGLWRHTLTVNALFDYAGGVKVTNENYPLSTDQAADALGSPLWRQARAVLDGEYPPGVEGFSSLDYSDGNYLSFRELSVACALPAAWARAVRVRNLSLVGAVRNLVLWTSYPYGDPEVSDGSGLVQNSASNVASVNNDLRRWDGSVVPLTRQWMLRLNLGF